MNTEQMMEIINTLAAKLGTTAEHVYEVLLMQTYLHGIYFLIAAIISTIICYLGVKIFKVARECSDENSVLGGIIMVTVGGCISMLCYFNAITNLVNPEYSVINRLIDMVR